MAITTKARIEKYLLTSIDAAFDAQVAEWIAGVEREIDKMTDRQMIADDVAAEYAYDGLGKKHLMIDDFYTISTVEVKSEKDDATPEDVTSYCYYYPANRSPKYQIQADNYTFPKGRQNVIVTGRRGYFPSDAIGEDLIFAATILVAGIINASNVSSGEIKRETIGRYTVEYETDQQKLDFKNAMSIIRSYRRIR